MKNNDEKTKKTKKTPQKNHFYRFFRFLLRPLIKLVWPTEFLHKENFYKLDKNQRAIVCSNHLDTMDPNVICVEFYKDYFCALSKYEAFSNKFANWFLTKIEVIPVHRGEPDLHATRAVFKKLKENKKIVIFPEGTRNKTGNDKTMLPLKDGVAAFSLKTDTPIVPMLYYRKLKPFKKNWLIVGEPFYLTDKFDHVPTVKEGTEYLAKVFEGLRTEIDAYVEKKDA